MGAKGRMSGSMLPRHRFTTDEYERMVESGILTPDDRVELLEGEIVPMTAIGSRHAECVRRLTRLLIERLGDEAIVSVQSPVRLDDSSMPEPDIAVLRPRPGGYASAHPTPPDIFLIIEVADTSLQRDRESKMPLCAQAGIQEAWLVHLDEGIVELHRRPAADGYQHRQRVAKGRLRIPGVPSEVQLQVEEIIP